MIFDKETLFSENQAITADAGSTNVIDLGATGTPAGHLGALIRDVGPGNPIEIWISVQESFDALTSLTVTVQTDTADTFGSPTTIGTSLAIPLATLVAGYYFRFPAYWPEGGTERYVRLFYDVTGTNPTTGEIMAGVVMARQTN